MVLQLSRAPATPPSLNPSSLRLTFSVSTFFTIAEMFNFCNVFRGAPLDVNNEHHHSRFFLAITPFSIPLESAMHIWDGSFQMNLAF